MSKEHYCTGEDCFMCERKIDEAEYERHVFPDDFPDYYDGT